MIDGLGPVQVIINVMMRYHGLLELIINDNNLLFTSKFWSSLCYFFGIKRKLSTTFYLQTDGQTKK